MTERLVLHAAADLVEAPVRDLHNVEGVSDPDRVVEPACQGRPVGLGEIRRHNADLPKPLLGSAVEPGTQVVAGVSLDHVDQNIAGAAAAVSGLAGALFVVVVVMTLLRGRRTEEPDRLLPQAAA